MERRETDCPMSGTNDSKPAGKHNHGGAAAEAFVSLRFCRSTGLVPELVLRLEQRGMME